MSGTVVFSWDWRQQPPMEGIAEAVADLTEDGVHLVMVDTGSDEYGLIVTDREMTLAEQQEAWAAR